MKLLIASILLVSLNANASQHNEDLRKAQAAKQTKFHYGQEVKILTGFYRGLTGRVTEYITARGCYLVDAVDERNKPVSDVGCQEESNLELVNP